MSTILAIDPGTTESGYCVFRDDRVVHAGVRGNAFMRCYIKDWQKPDLFAIEMVASYGMPVGREVFETCVWIGRFIEAWGAPNRTRLVYRQDVKLHLCGNPRAKDTNIRTALIDKLGPVGTKGNPGPLYGVKSHAWAALAVAVTAAETQPKEPLK